MASRGNQHCANCIGTLSFPLGWRSDLPCPHPCQPQLLTYMCDIGFQPPAKASFGANPHVRKAIIIIIIIIIINCSCNHNFVCLA